MIGGPTPTNEAAEFEAWREARNEAELAEFHAWRD
jgi:hypothetical protein